MLGIVVGTACLIGLIKVIRGRRYAYYAHHGGGNCGSHHGCGSWGGGWHGRWRGRDRFDRGFDDEGGFDEQGPMVLRGLFVRLATTPGQERAIVEALRELRAAVKKAAEDKAKSAREVAAAMRGDDFKVENMGEAFVHLDSGAETLRDATFAALAKIHGVLDERQRRIVADFVSRSGAALEDLAAQV